MERRNFLKTAFLGALAGAFALKSNQIGAQAPKSGSTPQSGSAADKVPDLVAVMGGEPEQLFSEAIKAMGGMSRFVKKGQSVVVKPNIAWDRAPEIGANTNPILVSAIIKECFACGASKVTVFDHTCDEWKNCYKNSGIEDAAVKAGAKMAFANDEKYYREVDLPKAKNYKGVKMHEAILDCDVWINVPVLKEHGGAKLTAAMKNLMGIVWDRRKMHMNNLQQCIADCSTYEKKPVLNIVDAYRVMINNGPQGRTPDDSVVAKAIFMSTDIVAVDTAAANFYSQFQKLDVSKVGHIVKGSEAGIGTMDLSKLEVVKIKL